MKNLARLRKGCDAFDGGRLEIVRAEGDVLHYRRVGKTQTAEIILNRGPHLLAETAFGNPPRSTPAGFTVLVEDNAPLHVGYFSHLLILSRAPAGNRRSFVGTAGKPAPPGQQAPSNCTEKAGNGRKFYM